MKLLGFKEHLKENQKTWGLKSWFWWYWWGFVIKLQKLTGIDLDFDKEE